MDSWREELVHQAELWLRTPYHHNAEIIGVGVDCGHLLKACYVGANLIKDFDLGSYPPDWMMHRSEEIFKGHVESYLDLCDDKLPGDVVIWKQGRCFSHGGIITQWPRIIHAAARERQVVFADSDQGWLKKHDKLFYSIKSRL